MSGTSRPGGLDAGMAGLDDLGVTEDLVTGEAVVLDLRPASFLTRALAAALDYLILIAAALVLFFLLGYVFSVSDDAAFAAVSLLAIVTLVIGVPVTVETLTRGRSVGKIAAGLRVVRDDGGPIRMRQALVRALLAVAEILIASGSVAIIASLANRRGKRLGDLLAGTYVVRERSARDIAPPVEMPPRLAGWAAGIDLGRVPDRLALATRQFLSRTARLNPASRERLGVELAGRMGEFVAPLPPAGTHPEEFLAAVLAERRRRDLERLTAEAEVRAVRERRRAEAGPLSALGTGLVGED